MIYQDAYIRYRTGGRRRTWQNMIGTQSGTTPNQIGPRQDCYAPPPTTSDIIGTRYSVGSQSFPIPGSYTGAMYSNAKMLDNNKDNIVVTWSKDTDTSTIHIQPKPKSRSKSPMQKTTGPMVDETLMMDITQM